MKKIFAIFLLFVYGGFIASIYINAHQSVHASVCDNSGDKLLTNDVSGSKNSACKYPEIHQKFQHHFSNTIAPNAVRISFGNPNTVSELSASLLDRGAKADISRTSTSIVYPDLYLKNRVLLL